MPLCRQQFGTERGKCDAARPHTYAQPHTGLRLVAHNCHQGSDKRHSIHCHTARVFPAIDLSLSKAWTQCYTQLRQQFSQATQIFSVILRW